VRPEVLLDEDQPGHPRRGAQQNEVDAGMAEMSQKFRDSGGEILVPVA
jgi:hypothetical protein